MKKSRQKAILDLVRGGQITSQEELLESLQSRSIEVSQSTLSRDIQELKLAKTGGIYAVMGDQPARAPSDESIRRILRDFMTEVAIAQNIVVLKTGSGHASSVSQAIDEAGWPEIVGSIAGENTVFIVVHSNKESREVQERLLEYLK